MWRYCNENVLKGLRRSPFAHGKLFVFLGGAYGIIALVIGFSSGLFKLGMLHSNLVYVLPLTLFFFPVLLEESVFRGLIIPQNTKERGVGSVVFYTVLSTLLFVAWHPLNALTINPTAAPFFLNPYFLVIVFCLGIVCSLSYIYSQSLWLPLGLHWLTVIVWVLFLGGRNLILNG